MKDPMKSIPFLPKIISRGGWGLGRVGGSCKGEGGVGHARVGWGGVGHAGVGWGVGCVM